MSELPVIVGAKAQTRSERLLGDKGDQLVYGADGSLVLYSATAIEGVLVSEHRPCLLVVDDVKFTIVRYTLEGKQHVYRCQPWSPGPYEREGAVVYYDPDRVSRDRVERMHFVARVLLLFCLFPFMPLLGMLPEGAKQKLKDHALLPTGAQMSSLVLEYLLALAVTAAELISVIAGELWWAALFAVCALTLLIDIPHRVVLATEGRDIGMFAWPRELWRGMRTPAPEQPAPQLPDADKDA